VYGELPRFPFWQWLCLCQWLKLRRGFIQEICLRLLFLSNRLLLFAGEFAYIIGFQEVENLLGIRVGQLLPRTRKIVQVESDALRDPLIKRAF
jgi:hypothetical protein